VVGNLQITGTALPDQATFTELQEVDGNILIANNNAMAAFDFYSLRFAGSGISLFQNPAIASFEAPRLTAVASNAPDDVITTGLQVRPSLHLFHHDHLSISDHQLPACLSCTRENL
jgi:hypothetical protein